VVFVRESLVVAALNKDRENQQIGVREKPLIRFCASSFRGPRNEAQVAAAGKVPKVVRADSGETANLVFSEQLLARPDRQHGWASLRSSTMQNAW
jgi:hypothetical protein